MATLAEVKKWCMSFARENGAVFLSDTPITQAAIKALVSEGELVWVGGLEYRIPIKAIPCHGRRLV